MTKTYAAETFRNYEQERERLAKNAERFLAAQRLEASLAAERLAKIRGTK